MEVPVVLERRIDFPTAEDSEEFQLKEQAQGNGRSFEADATAAVERHGSNASRLSSSDGLPSRQRLRLKFLEEIRSIGHAGELDYI